jgi:hydroxymethylpyrimidine/phosphomethylpyrimidine kinase
MVSTSGSQLLPGEAVTTLIDNLLPLTTILTPNLPEAKLLLENAGVEVSDPTNVDEIVAMAHKLQGLGPRWVLLKGGHLPLTQGRVVSRSESEHEVVLNVLVGEGGLNIMESKYLKSNNTHGTGCSLACTSTPSAWTCFQRSEHTDKSQAAIACNLASGMSMIKAVKKANQYIEAGIKTSVSLGKGTGPINHFHSTYTLPFTTSVPNHYFVLNVRLIAAAAPSSHIYWTETIFSDHGNSTPNTTLSSEWRTAHFPSRTSGII